MEQEKKYEQWVENRVSKKRFLHILSVVKEGEKLAKKYKADVKKVRIAALFHDVAKELSLESMQNLCQQKKFSDLSGEDLKKGQILHGFAASVLVENELGIEDVEILEAIAYHTIGKKNLSLVAKIVYIADAIEESRNYSGVKEIREKTYQNLEEGILLELKQKEKYLTSIGATLHPNTKAWKVSLEEENHERKVCTRNV